MRRKADRWNDSLRKLLKKKIKESGKTFTEVSYIIGHSRSYVTGALSAHHQLDMKSYLKICAAVLIDPADTLAEAMGDDSPRAQEKKSDELMERMARLEETLKQFVP